MWRWDSNLGANTFAPLSILLPWPRDQDRGVVGTGKQKMCSDWLPFRKDLLRGILLVAQAIFF